MKVKPQLAALLSIAALAVMGLATGGAVAAEEKSPASWSSLVTISANPTSVPTHIVGRLQDTEHRPHRQGRHLVHRLLRREQLYRGARDDVHHRAIRVPASLTKVRVPGALIGLQARDITIAQALKPRLCHGSVRQEPSGRSGQFLPTNHGFDEFFGNLYHLNAEEEPERPYWMGNNPDFLKSYNPRGVIHSFADGKITDMAPLNKKRMETIDDETTAACMDFIDRQVKAQKPFFVWMNFTRMHIFTHVREAYRGKGGMGPRGNEYADGMWEFDQDVGKLLKQLDDLKIADNTIVVFTTDNGPNLFTWPDAASSPFRSEKDSNWEGAFRVPAMVRWPGHIKPGEVVNGMFSGLDWFPTLMAAVGDTTIKERLLKGAQIGDKTFKVHLDGYNQLPLLTGQTDKSARDEYYYFDDDGELVSMRYDVVLPNATNPTAWRRSFSPSSARSEVRHLEEPVHQPAHPRFTTCAWTPL
ncbi:MAG: sulfatase-like hydrolase/transferase [Candidatus Competibacteraceae bacterium]